ncbi:hypothetical protein LOZ64_001614 [Ophidiomyces ophidiicola]|nr:hypothetical protein LOZ64_001614 [Ophidiomyces ophidiicola]KAI2006471.1 hypothetical protein LOZ49_005002 [Ophidiomyces ophidiicola]KAI2023244.1 hypothetical protein LOZ46_001575 [Ophidiomyces ophidiicola]KAI2140985.1 hypothetical protein LOZ29_001944 [Ophidiomyces ophidiicola]KAI2142556.1 hypothetical protein LOZ28_002091 [Ophidiomyces ophidiicola]
MAPNLIVALITAPRFRRYLLVYSILLAICGFTWIEFASPRLKEHGVLLRSLDQNNKDLVGGWFGTNSKPRFPEFIHLATLDSRFLPERGETDKISKRLVVVGDVHGCLDELDKLLRKISFNHEAGDHLIFAGDLINKGPKSVEVIQAARMYNSSCVRGNNEDRILLYRQELDHRGGLSFVNPKTNIGLPNDELGGITEGESLENEILPFGKHQEHVIARDLSEEDAAWLHKCPVILKVGHIKGMGEVVVVHGGLAPGVPLENQDPYSVMTMRTLDLDTHAPSSSSDGMSWAKVFNKYQSLYTSSTSGTSKPEPTTVIYGHTPHKSPALLQFTKGLDTGCVKGGKLTALVIEDGKTKIKQVRCKSYV